MVFLTNINLNKNELQNAVIQPLSVAPSNPVLGQIYFNSSTKKLMQWDGTTWISVGVAVSASSTNGNITVDGTDITVYTLPTASDSSLGGVKVGSKLSIANDGTLSADAQAWTDITGKPSNIVTDASYVHTDNNFTTTLKDKLDGIASGAEVNVNADWDAVSGDAQILNKPSIPTKTSDLNNDSDFQTSTDVATAISGKLDKSGGTMTGALTLSGAPTQNLHAATKKYVDDGLSGKQATLTFDSTPTASSTNPVTSGGVYSAIPTKTSDLNNDSGFITSNDIPEGAAASTTSPKMDGTATVGTEMAFARGDHIHPTDTSRAPLASPALTGVPTAPTASSGTNTTQIATTAFVQTAIGGLALITISVVNSLPSTGQSNVIYLVPKSTSQTNNAYDEYIWVASTSKFEKIGDTEIDLSGYLTTNGNASSTTVTFTAASSRTLPTTGDTLATIIGKATKYFTDLSTVAFSGSYADLSNKPTEIKINTATLTTSQTTKSITASGSNVANVQIVDSVTHEQVMCDVTINGNAVTVSTSVAPTNVLNITVMSY